MTSTYRTAADAIARSISHNEIVTLDYDGAIAAGLSVECEGSTEGNEGLMDYWGTTEDGDEWRVEMRAADEVSDDQIEALRTEAAQAGDMVQVNICGRALRGSTTARRACARVLADAAAQD